MSDMLQLVVKIGNYTVWTRLLPNVVHASVASTLTSWIESSEPHDKLKHVGHRQA